MKAVEAGIDQASMVTVDSWEKAASWEKVAAILVVEEDTVMVVVVVVGIEPAKVGLECTSRTCPRRARLGCHPRGLGLLRRQSEGPCLLAPPDVSSHIAF